MRGVREERGVMHVHGASSRWSDVGLAPPVWNVLQSEVFAEVTWSQALLRKKRGRNKPINQSIQGFLGGHPDYRKRFKERDSVPSVYTKA